MIKPKGKLIMKINPVYLILILAGLHLTIGHNLFSGNDLSSEKEFQSTRKLLYKPRAANAQEVRVDGNSRSVDIGSPSLYVLAPEHTGYTIKEKPTLYWYQSKTANAKFEFNIVGEDPSKPIFTIGYTPAAGTGIQSLQLREHDVRLKKGIEYSWYVTIISDPEHRTKDIFASGAIECIDPPINVAKSLTNKSKKDLAYILAEEGIWYDALDIISHLIEANPKETLFKELRAELLDQGNLSEAAEYARLN